jgi:lipopolysaccharide transport system permease protein
MSATASRIEAVVEARPPTWARCLDPRGLVAVVRRHRDLITHMIRRNVTARYQGSFLGAGWAVLQPLLMLAVYTYVFGIVFQARWRAESTGNVEFALTLFCGLIPFGLIGETAANAPGIVVGHAAYVKRVVFPLEILPMTVVGSAIVVAAISTAVLLAAEAVMLQVPPASALLLPLAFVPAVLIAMALGWLLAALGVFVRDTAAIVGFVMQLLFFATPILYPPSAVPERFRLIVSLNPLAPIVEAFRALALGLTPAPWRSLAIISLAALIAALFCRALFLRAQRAFADVV